MKCQKCFEGIASWLCLGCGMEVCESCAASWMNWFEGYCDDCTESIPANSQPAADRTPQSPVDPDRYSIAAREASLRSLSPVFGSQAVHNSISGPS